MCKSPIIPVLTIERIGDAIPIAQALIKGGLSVLEVTLRTACALEAISEIKQLPGAIVGAGTVLDQKLLDQAIKAGSDFLVSPGLTTELAAAATASDIPFLPGVATASEIMRGLDLGLDRFKFFPAEANGGIPALRAISAPFTMARFCPTGGITQDSAAKWLKLDQVLCVGGSWMIATGPLEPKIIEDVARNALMKLRCPAKLSTGDSTNG